MGMGVYVNRRSNLSWMCPLLVYGYESTMGLSFIMGNHVYGVHRHHGNGVHQHGYGVHYGYGSPTGQKSAKRKENARYFTLEI